MKKIFCVAVAILLVLSSFSVSVFANGDGEISGNVLYSAPNKTVEVPIKYTNNPGFWLMYVDINFDPEIFEYAGVENGEYNKLKITDYTYEKNPGKVLLFAEGEEYANLSGDAVIATLKLHVKENVKVGNYAIDVSEADAKIANFDAKIVRPKYTDGSVYVICSEHSFSDNTCTVCGAVKDGDGVKLDPEKFPEAVKPVIKDINNSVVQTEDENSSNNPSSDVSKEANQSGLAENNETGNKPNTTLLILICSGALLVICAVVVFVIVKKKK